MKWKIENLRWISAIGKMSSTVLVTVIATANVYGQDAATLKQFMEKHNIGKIQMIDDEKSGLNLLLEKGKKAKPVKFRPSKGKCRVLDYRRACVVTEALFKKIYAQYKCKHVNMYHMNVC